MSPPDIEQALRNLRDRIADLERNERSEVAGAVPSVTVVNLPVFGQPGRLRYASDGRKMGEGPGAGTGVVVYDDGTAWRRPSDDTAVLT